MITVSEYIRRRDENTKEYLAQIKNGSFDILKFHGFDAIAGQLNRWEISPKTYDILSAVILGFLPILITKSGTDAIKLDQNQFVPVELKSTYTDETKFVKTSKNAIYSVTPDKIINGEVLKNSTTSIKSNFNASFNIVDNLGVKNIDTYLIAADRVTDNHIIECLMMEGEVIGKYLEGRTIPPSGSVPIKLSTFEKFGKPYRDTIIPVLGFETWRNQLLPTLPLVQVKSPPRGRQKSNNILPKIDYRASAKNHPSLQISSPYIEVLDLSKTLNSADIPPNDLSAKS